MVKKKTAQRRVLKYPDTLYVTMEIDQGDKYFTAVDDMFDFGGERKGAKVAMCRLESVGELKTIVAFKESAG